jgi:hypothetical protein
LKHHYKNFISVIIVQNTCTLKENIGNTSGIGMANKVKEKRAQRDVENDADETEPRIASESGTKIDSFQIPKS